MCEIHQKQFNTTTLQVVGHNTFVDNGIQLVYDSAKKRYGQKLIIEILCEKANIVKPQKYIPFIFSANFMVRKSQIVQHSIETYENLKHFLLVESENSQGGFQGYILERFWVYLFTLQSYSSLDQYYSELLMNANKIQNVSKKDETTDVPLDWEKDWHVEEDIDFILEFEQNNIIKRLPNIKITKLRPNVHSEIH